MEPFEGMLTGGVFACEATPTAPVRSVGEQKSSSLSCLLLLEGRVGRDLLLGGKPH